MHKLDKSSGKKAISRKRMPKGRDESKASSDRKLAHAPTKGGKLAPAASGKIARMLSMLRISKGASITAIMWSADWVSMRCSRSVSLKPRECSMMGLATSMWSTASVRAVREKGSGLAAILRASSMRTWLERSADTPLTSMSSMGASSSVSRRPSARKTSVACRKSSRRLSLEDSSAKSFSSAKLDCADIPIPSSRDRG
jgi:hypothetical protein